MKNKLLCLIVAVAVLFLLIIYNYYFHNNIKIKKHGNKKYYVYEIDNILSSSECDKLIKYSKNKNFSDSTIFNNTQNVVDNSRKSKTTWIQLNENEIETKCSKMAKQLTNTNDHNLEPMQIVYYTIGGYFNPHHDATKNTNVNTIVTSREYTLLIYLNDVEKGGETVFPYLNLEIKPKKGKTEAARPIIPGKNPLT